MKKNQIHTLYLTLAENIYLFKLFHLFLSKIYTILTRFHAHPKRLCFHRDAQFNLIPHDNNYVKF